jgi:hypothetical protein
MVGDLALFNEISTSLKDNCGARWGKRMAKVGQLTEARRLIGVSTPREVKHQDGFRGTWDPGVQPKVDQMIDDMGRSKNFGDSLHEVLDEVGQDRALVVTGHDKRRRVSSEDELESSGDSNAELMGMLRGISSQLTQNSARLDALEVGVKDLPRTDDERQNTNRGGKSAPPASKADKLSHLLGEWNSSAGASPPAGASVNTPVSISGESLVKPNYKWVEGQCLFCYDFASKSGDSIQDLVASKLNRDTKDGYSLSLDGEKRFTIKAKNLAVEVNTMVERALCVQRFVAWSHVFNVKNLTTELQRAQFLSYETRILKLSLKFKFKFVVEYDVLFQSRLFDGPTVEDGLSSWSDRPMELYNDVFLARLYTRIGDNPPSQWQAHNKDDSGDTSNKINKEKYPKLKDFDADGNPLCWNFNRGHCLDKKDKSGNACTREHLCQFCLGDHALKDCDDYNDD